MQDASANDAAAIGAANPIMSETQSERPPWNQCGVV
jgi:hypothetical protein